MIKRSASFGLLLAALGLLSETETLDAGTVDLVYGGSLLDGALNFMMIDRLRQIKGQYDAINIQSLVYSTWHKSSGSFSFKTTHAAELYSPVFHFDGHGDLLIYAAKRPPLLKDIVFIDACSGFKLLPYFNGCSRVFMGWKGTVFVPVAYSWSGYFYEALFNLYEQGHHYTIRQAHDYASTMNDLHIQVGYVQIRVPRPDPEIHPCVEGGDHRSVDDFEKTYW